MPIYVILGNWTDQGTRDFGGAGSVRKTVDLIWSVVFIGWGCGLRK
jgi:hypothetical protein